MADAKISALTAAASAAGANEYAINEAGTTKKVTGTQIKELVLGDADAADLTKLSEVTATSTELNYVDGVTSAIQDQLDAKVGTDEFISASGSLTLAGADAVTLTTTAATNVTLPTTGTLATTTEAKTEAIQVACSDETTDLEVDTGILTFRMPYAMTLTAVRASVTTAPAGANLIVDINEGGTSVLSTEINIDDGDKTSVGSSTAAVISDSALADDAEITIDIDQIGSGTAGAGLKVTLIGTRA